MKKIIYVLGFLTMFASCKPDYSDLVYKDKPFLAFSTLKVQVAEGNGATGNTTKLTVSRATSEIGVPITVNFSVSAKYADTGANADNSFTVMGAGGSATSVVIPAGKTTADITITTKPNTVSEKNRIITVTMTGANSDLNLGYPGPSANGKSAEVTINDDDCAFDIAKFTGAYNCDEPGYKIYDVTFTQVSATEIINDNFWDWGASIKYVLDPLTNTVTIPSQNFTGFGANNVTGTGGVIEPCTGKMTVPYTVTGPSGESKIHTFTRK